ncbi:MAG TPA: MxaK protein [Methylocella sp.]|nr:MxaK protein [Methylocella sp.]
MTYLLHALNRLQSSVKSAARESLHSLLGVWRHSRPAITAAVLAISLAASVINAYVWMRIHAANATIVMLAGGHDVQVSAGVPPEALLARIVFLTKRDDTDTPRELISFLERAGNPELTAYARYDLANALLRRAFSALDRGEIEKAGPYINLARLEYRRALQLVPQFWDAKYNFDVASRLIREYPQINRESGAELPANPRKIWTDIPGVPKGLP